MGSGILVIYTEFVKRPERRNPFGDIDIDEVVLLKWIVE
jgi:hypothetical protein